MGSVETEAGWAVRGLGPGRGVGFVGTGLRLGKVAEFGERQVVVTCLPERMNLTSLRWPKSGEGGKLLLCIF